MKIIFKLLLSVVSVFIIYGNVHAQHNPPQKVNSWYQFTGTTNDSVSVLPNVQTPVYYRRPGANYWNPTDSNWYVWTGTQFLCKTCLPFIPPLRYLGNTRSVTKRPDTLIYSVYNVLDFGAKNDSTGNAADAWDSIIAICVRNRGGTIYFPSGRYRTTRTMRVPQNCPVSVKGDGSPAFDLITTLSVGPLLKGASIICNVSSSDTCIINQSNGFSMWGITLAYTGPSAVTTNVGLYLDSATRANVDNCGFFNFNENLTVRHGIGFVIQNSIACDGHSVNYKFRNYDGLDAGDGRIINCENYVFNPAVSSNDTALSYWNGGGLQIIGCKLGGGKVGISIPWMSFSDIVIAHTSIEGISDIALKVDIQPSSQMANLHIVNNQFIFGGHRGVTIRGNGGPISNVVIDGNIISSSNLISTDTCIVIEDNVLNCKIGPTNVFSNASHSIVFIGAPSFPGTSYTTPANLLFSNPVGNNIHLDASLLNTGVSILTSQDTVNLNNAAPGNIMTLLVQQDVTGSHKLIAGSGLTNYPGNLTNEIPIDTNNQKNSIIIIRATGNTTGNIEQVIWLSNPSAYFPFTSVVFTPLTSTAISVARNSYNTINPAGTIAALSIVLPSSPVQNDYVEFNSTQTVSTVVFFGGTVVNPPLSFAPGSYRKIVYNFSDNKWY